MGRAASVRTQSPVALAISSPTFLGDRPRGPILGASAEEAPISPPVALKVLHTRSFRHLKDDGEYLTLKRSWSGRAVLLTFPSPRWDRIWEL